MTVGPVVLPGEPGFPKWAAGYLAVRQLNDGDWLVLMPLWGAGRTRLQVANEGGCYGPFY